MLATVDHLPLIGERAAISAGAVGILLGRGLGVVEVLLGVLARRFSRTQLIKASMLLTGMLVPTIAVVSNPWPLGALLVMLGFFLGLGQPLTMTLITTTVPPNSRGAALAVRMLGNKAGQVAPAVIASATVVVGCGGGFILLGLILAAATVGASRFR